MTTAQTEARIEQLESETHRTILPICVLAMLTTTPRFLSEDYPGTTGIFMGVLLTLLIQFWWRLVRHTWELSRLRKSIKPRTS